MLRGQLLVLTFSLCVLGVSVSASERQSLPDASQPQSDQPERQADNAPPSTPASEPQADGAQAPLSSPPLASDPPPPLAADPSPPPAPVGFAREFAERLATEGKLSAADRAERAALSERVFRAIEEFIVWTSLGLPGARLPGPVRVAQ